jgi:hypothetical protein
MKAVKANQKKELGIKHGTGLNWYKTTEKIRHKLQSAGGPNFTITEGIN